MPDQDEAQDDETGSGKPPAPVTPVDGEGPPDEAAPDGSGQPSRGKGPSALLFLRELNTNERITALLAFGSICIGAGALAVAYETWQTARDSSDIKAAIGNLSTLAVQTKRQADGQRDQLAALREQVAEARAQTRAISEQTNAIKTSSAAALRTAAAQAKIADVEIKTAQAEIAAAQAQEISARAVAQANLPSLFLSSIEFNGLDASPDASGQITIKVKPIFGNNGGTMFQGATIFSLTYIPLSTDPDFSKSFIFGGNEISTPNGGAFYPTQPVSVTLPKNIAASFLDGKVPLFIAGGTTYTDAAKQQHQWCFAYIVMHRPEGFAYYQTGGPAYHCQT